MDCLIAHLSNHFLILIKTHVVSIAFGHFSHFLTIFRHHLLNYISVKEQPPTKHSAMGVKKKAFVLLLLFLPYLKLVASHCEGKCEQSIGSFGQTGIKHRAILGHSIWNFTVKKAFDCHMKCFDEKGRCQAYQMWNDRCELLDEDRMSAPDDFINADGYRYFDMSREYVNKVKCPF